MGKPTCPLGHGEAGPVSLLKRMIDLRLSASKGLWRLQLPYEIRLLLKGHLKVLSPIIAQNRP